MRCAQCKNKLLQKTDAGVRVRTKGALIFDGDGHCLAQCYWCGTPVVLPLKLTAEVPLEPERFVLVPKKP